MGLTNWIIKKGAKNLTEDFVSKYHTVKNANPDKPEQEILKITLGQFSAPGDFKAALWLQNNQSFWDTNPDMKEVARALIITKSSMAVGWGSKLSSDHIKILNEALDEVLSRTEDNPSASNQSTNLFDQLEEVQPEEGQEKEAYVLFHPKKNDQK